MSDKEQQAPASKHSEFLHRVVLMDGVALIFLLVLAGIWYSAEAILLVFACILFAILLFELSKLVQKRLHVRSRYALPIVVFAILAIIGGGGVLMAPQISDQADKLTDAVPRALTELRQTLGQYDLARRLLGGIPSDEQLRKHVTSMLPNAGLFFSGVLGAVGNVLIISFVGIYFAAKPMLYIEGLVTLVPQSKRARAREVLAEFNDGLVLVGNGAVAVALRGVVAEVRRRGHLGR